MKPIDICPRCNSRFDPPLTDDCPFCARTVEMPVPDQVANDSASPAPTAEDSGKIHIDDTVTWQNCDDSNAQTPVEVDMARLTALLSPPETPDELGRLGDYRILRIVGAGGMGVIFEAEDLMLRRRAAVKAMLPSVAVDPANRNRFLREARTAAAISHDHIVTIYQVAENGGVLYLAMEYLEGESLADQLQREERLPLDELLRIGSETAKGLAAAHKRGLIHRDIKPGNLWIQSETRRVKILDFGLARPAVDNAEITKSGMILGTPAYMAPEQARGQTIDSRCDLYSLGTVIFRMATGRLPFPGLDAVSTLTALVSDEPPSIIDVVDELPFELGKLASQLMAKNPDDRPADADEVLTALAEIQSRYLETHGQPILTDDDPEFKDATLQPTAEPTTSDGGDAIEEFDDIELIDDDAPLPLVPPSKFKKLCGRLIAHYRLERLIGAGHFGAVFDAIDESNNQPVAIKLIDPAFPNGEQERNQFVQAMRASLALQHNHLVRVIGAGRTEPYCWIAMEKVEGVGIDELIRRSRETGALDWRFGLRVAIHVSRALFAVNQGRRHVHRNITPANILVEAADETVKLNDLLLIRALAGSDLYASVLDEKTAAEMHFIAPEQASGEASFVDSLCDMYSLGVVVYMLLTGRPPFVAETLSDALPIIRENTPERPRKIVNSVPVKLDNVVMRMLEKKQEARYQDFSQLLIELTGIAKAHDLDV